jgi:hypothetical protein
MPTAVAPSNSTSFEDAAVMKLVEPFIVHATRLVEFLKQFTDISFDRRKARLPDALLKASCV